MRQTLSYLILTKFIKNNWPPTLHLEHKSHTFLPNPAATLMRRVKVDRNMFSIRVKATSPGRVVWQFVPVYEPFSICSPSPGSSHHGTGEDMNMMKSSLIPRWLCMWWKWRKQVGFYSLFSSLSNLASISSPTQKWKCHQTHTHPVPLSKARGVTGI